MNRLIFAFLLLSLATCKLKKQASTGLIEPAIKPDTFTLAFWNVENLFDTLDGANRDEDFTPNGYDHWTDEVYHKKLNHLSQTINDINADILGVCEVENRGVLADLRNNTAGLQNHSIVHYDSPDERGIDVALFYDSTLFDQISSEAIGVSLAKDDKTRDILHVQLTLKHSFDTFSVFVNHWPSRSGGQARSNPNRFAAAKALKNEIQKLSHSYMILGDLNDGPTDSSVSVILEACTKENNNANCRSFNLSGNIDTRNEGTHKYHGHWNMLDHIILSYDMLSNKHGFIWKEGSFNIFKPNYLIQQTGKYEGYPYRALAGGKFIGGYSDHLPLYCIIIHQ